MISFFKSCWHRRWFRVTTWILASLVTLFVLFYQWVNWQGARAWRAEQEAFVREGETLNFRAIMPDPVPDEQNFCAIPALKDLALVVDRDPDKGAPAEKRKRLESCGLPTGEKLKGTGPPSKLAASGTLGIPTDLKAWADWLRAEGSLSMPPASGNPARDILGGLSKHDAFVGELASALDRPEAQWTPAWKTRELPEVIFSISLLHYASLREFVPMLCLRAVAAARAGEPAKAHESLLVALKLIRASLADPFLIGALVAASQFQQAQCAIWEVCAAHAGSAEDFRRLQNELELLDFHAALLRDFRAELAGGTDAVMWMKQKRDAQILDVIANAEGNPNSSWPDKLLVNCIPSGWFDQNAATMVGLEFEYILKPLREGNLLALCIDTGFERELKQRKGANRLDSVMACLFLPAVMSIGPRMAFAQCQTNEAVAACALERWLIRHGAYPETLDSISREDGKTLPRDVLSAKSMGYRKTPDGRYALWCVGMDGKDDGGKRVVDVKEPENTKFHERGYTGDWVWDFPKER